MMTIALASCDNSKIGEEERDGLVQASIEKYYQEHGAHKTGYEFVSLEVINTVYYKDNIEFRRKYIQKEIDHNRGMLEIATLKQDTFPTVNFADKIAEYQGKLDKYEQLLAGIDSLDKALGDEVKEVASYTYLFKCKEHNEQGQQIEKAYYVQTDPGYGVLRFTDNKEDLFPNPNDFPGYHDMAAKILVDPY